MYVDSGSSDDSVAFSRSLGVIVVNLDTSIPFTMARGRNAGFEELQRRFPALRWVQFVDGDCEVRPDWIARARAAYADRPEVATAASVLAGVGKVLSVVDRRYAFFQVGPSASGEYLNFFHSAIRNAKKERGFALVAAGAPDDKAHWVRFDDFRVARR